MGWGPKQHSFLPTVSDVKASRALDTVYQNTSTVSPLYVTVDIESTTDNTREVSIEIGSANPPTMIVQRSATGVVGLHTSLVALVPPGWYYRVVSITDTIVVANWHEGPLLG